MTTVHFHHLAEAIQEMLGSAQTELQIAVCWFTHAAIFDTVIDRLRTGVEVELLVEYDCQNIRTDGLDFDRFLQDGGRMFVRREPGLMHHKFAVVDNCLALTGSFNWTYNTNAENLIISDDPLLVAGFRKEFSRMLQSARPLVRICPEEVKAFSAYPLFENTWFDLDVLRRKIVRGARVWTVRLDRAGLATEEIFRTGRLYFDPNGCFTTFWRQAAFWDETLFDQFWKNLGNLITSVPGRTLRCWMRRIRPGDLLLAALPPNRVLGLAVVQSEPKPIVGHSCSSFLEIQWLRDLRYRPLLLAEKLAPWAVTRYRSSALKLLQQIFDQPGGKV